MHLETTFSSNPQLEAFALANPCKVDDIFETIDDDRKMYAVVSGHGANPDHPETYYPTIDNLEAKLGRQWEELCHVRKRQLWRMIESGRLPIDN